MVKTKKAKKPLQVIHVMKMNEGTEDEWSAIESDYKEFDLSDNLPHDIAVYELKKVIKVIRKVEIVTA